MKSAAWPRKRRKARASGRIWPPRPARWKDASSRPRRALSEWTAALENLRQQREAASAVLTETKVALATEEQLCASYASQKKPLEQRLAELGNLVEQRRRDIQSFLERNGQAEAENAPIAPEDGGVAAPTRAGQRAHRRVAGAKEGRGGGNRAGGRGPARGAAFVDELQEQRGALEVELAQKNMATQNLRDRVREKYQVNLDEVRSECITITLAEEGPPKVHTLTPEEMAASGVSTDWAAVAEQVPRCKSGLMKSGRSTWWPLTNMRKPSSAINS